MNANKRIYMPRPLPAIMTTKVNGFAMNHRRIDERSLVFGRAIAERLKKDPSIILRAKSTIRRWMKTCSPRALPALRQWEKVLDGPWQEVVRLLIEDNPRSAQLRQSNPFTGVLTPQERTAILRQFQSNDSAAA